MDRLISLEPSNVVVIRVKNGQKCYGELILRNVMYKGRYMIRPQSGIISPLTTVTVQITDEFSQNSSRLRLLPYCDDSFLLHSVVVPGASVKNASSTRDSVPSDWFAARKKQVFVDSGIRVMFVGSVVMASFVSDGLVLEKSDPSWRAIDSVDEEGQTLLYLTISQSRADLVQLLLEFEPDIEARNGLGSTPLEAAVASGEGLIVELLLAHRASTERPESSTWGPIHMGQLEGARRTFRGFFY